MMYINEQMNAETIHPPTLMCLAKLLEIWLLRKRPGFLQKKFSRISHMTSTCNKGFCLPHLPVKPLILLEILTSIIHLIILWGCHNKSKTILKFRVRLSNVFRKLSKSKMRLNSSSKCWLRAALLLSKALQLQIKSILNLEHLSKNQQTQKNQMFHCLNSKTLLWVRIL